MRLNFQSPKAGRVENVAPRGANIGAGLDLCIVQAERYHAVTAFDLSKPYDIARRSLKLFGLDNLGRQEATGWPAGSSKACADHV